MLAIRNLATQSLALKTIERYDGTSSQCIPAAKETSSWRFPGWDTTKNTPTQDELSERCQHYSSQEVDILMPPLSMHSIVCKPTTEQPGQQLRLTLQEANGTSKWRLDVPHYPSLSTRLVPLVCHPTQNYTAFRCDSTTLVILEDLNLSSWMRNFEDDTSITALSIPGTHNSPTCYKALPSVRCQAVSITDQLMNGVRFLDVRLQPSKSSDLSIDHGLKLVHGAFPISLSGHKTFRSLLNEVTTFLETNQSETIILSLKREGVGNGTDEQLSLLLRDHYVSDLAQWYTEPRIPCLGEVRGKIVILRRFAIADNLKQQWEGRGWCLDGEEWDYNTPDCMYGDVRVQDFCDVGDNPGIEQKMKHCCSHFERAAQVICPIRGVTTDIDHPVPAGPLYLNYLTASSFWNRSCWPEAIAARLNPYIRSFLCKEHAIDSEDTPSLELRVQGDGGVGIVVCDWVGKDKDWSLVKTIIAMNGKLLLRQRGV